MNEDFQDYMKYTYRSRLSKALNTLNGIIQGINIDAEISIAEVEFLKTWLDDNRRFAKRHPFNEIVPIIETVLSDGIITEEEKADLLWICEKIQSSEFAQQAVAEIQKLHGVLGGIASDGKITEAELRGLSSWLSDHEHLATIYPYDEVVGVVSGVLADGKIDENEHKMLLGFFQEFTAILDDRTIKSPVFSDGARLVGVCAIQPKITFEEQTFCLTGKSYRYGRDEFLDVIRQRGGRVVANMSSRVKYLIVGSDGNPCWAFACYGRKVEQAIELRKSGSRLLIVHENDFHDAVEDAG